jgi:nucleoside-diphosphate-sugar epimerase
MAKMILALVANIDRARQQLGWRPRLTLRDGLRQLVASTIGDGERAAAVAAEQPR